MSAELRSDAILAGDDLHADGPRTESRIGGYVRRISEIFFNLSAIALVVASLVLTGGVVAGHLLGRGLEWQDEMEIFLVAGAVFLSAAAVQARRGHIGIEVLGSFLSARWRERRNVVIDALSFIFVAFIAWKSGALVYEAWTEQQVSQSTWAPPMWIPYALMTLGMALLALQIAVQAGEKSLIVLLAGGGGGCRAASLAAARDADNRWAVASHGRDRLLRRDAARHVLGHSHRLCAGRRGHDVHVPVHAARVGRYHCAECL